MQKLGIYSTNLLFRVKINQLYADMKHMHGC